MPTYRFTMTITRVAEYVADAEFATWEEADEYAENLTPDDMTDIDDYATDVHIDVALIEE